MTYIKINENLYPASVSGRMTDKDWDNRSSKSITLEMSYAEAVELFVDGLVWSIVQREEIPVEKPIYEVDENGELILDENGQPIQIGTEPGVDTKETEFDNSDYNLAGDITDHRDGNITVKMGKLTELEEAYELMLGDVENEPIPEDTEPSEIEGENEPVPEDTEIPEVEGENEPVPEGEEIPEPIPEDTEVIEGEDNENTIDGDITEGGIE